VRAILLTPLLALVILTSLGCGSGSTTASENPVSQCVNINTAPQQELRRIVHIDELRAQQIIQLRQERRFASVDELTRVSGIAAARLADIKAQGLACV